MSKEEEFKRPVYAFKGLMYDVFTLEKSGSITKRYPELEVYPEFNPKLYLEMKPLDFNDLMKYVVAVYDKKGLRVYEENVSKRKKIAANMVGWRQNADGGYPLKIEAILTNKNGLVNALIIRYLKLMRSVEYSSLVAFEEQYFNMISKMIQEDISKQDHEAFVKVEESLNRRVLDFCSGDYAKGLHNSIYESIELEKLGLRPEDIARKLRNGDDIVDVKPYGNWKGNRLLLIPGDDETE